MRPRRRASAGRHRSPRPATGRAGRGGGGPRTVSRSSPCPGRRAATEERPGKVGKWKGSFLTSYLFFLIIHKRLAYFDRLQAGRGPPKPPPMANEVGRFCGTANT